MDELIFAHGNAHMRGTAADSFEEHEIARPNVVAIDWVPLVVLLADFARQRCAMLCEYPLDEAAAIEPPSRFHAPVQIWNASEREGRCYQSR
jgi:hypothetical protein